MLYDTNISISEVGIQPSRLMSTVENPYVNWGRYLVKYNTFYMYFRSSDHNCLDVIIGYVALAK